MQTQGLSERTSSKLRKRFSCTFLDIHMHVVDGIIHTKLYDKRDDFKFTINNYPNLSGNIHAKRTHDIIISHNSYDIVEHVNMPKTLLPRLRHYDRNYLLSFSTREI